jgi:hypothetical protein
VNGNIELPNYDTFRYFVVWKFKKNWIFADNILGGKGYTILHHKKKDAMCIEVPAMQKILQY